MTHDNPLPDEETRPPPILATFVSDTSEPGIPAAPAPAADATRPVAARPRIWPTVTVPILAIILSAILSTAAIVIAALVDAGPTTMSDSSLYWIWLEDFYTRPEGLFVISVPSQSVLLCAALGAALLSPIPWQCRLGLARGALPVWNWFAFAIATPMVGLVTWFVASHFLTDMGENLEVLNRIMGSFGGSRLPLVFLLIALIPGVVEELLFRGYVQTRLLARLPAGVAILISSVLFAIAHMDPIHSLLVLPLGIWMGVVAWQAKSILPAMLCHIVNNSVSILETQLNSPDTVDNHFTYTDWGILLACGPAMIVSVFLLTQASVTAGPTTSEKLL